MTAGATMKNSTQRVRRVRKIHRSAIGAAGELINITPQQEAFAMWKKMGLQTRTANTLIANNILTLKQLKEIPFRRLCFFENLGLTGLVSIHKILNPNRSLDLPLYSLSSAQIHISEEWIYKIGEHKFLELLNQLSQIVIENFEREQRPHAIHTFCAIVRQKARIR